MDSILNLIANEANVRLLVTLAFVSCAYMFIRGQMKDMGHSIKSDLAAMSKRIDSLEASIKSELVAVHCRIDEVEFSLNKRIDSVDKRIDGVEASIKELKGTMNGRIDELKHNDIAHLNGTIEALTYALEKNGSLKHEDKEYVDSRLAH